MQVCPRDGPSETTGSGERRMAAGAGAMSKNLVYHDESHSPEIQSENECPECDSNAVVADEVRGELVCRACGCILKNGLIDTGAEWSAYPNSESEELSRVGSPLTELLHDRGMTTTIHWQDADASGTALSARKQQQVQRLRTWQERIRVTGAGERNLQLALTEITRMASALGLPESTRKAASVIYREALDADLLKGWSIEGVATGCLYIACRKERIPRSLDEFETVSRVERTEIGRSYRNLASELDIEMKPVQPERFVPRFCSELDVGPAVQRRATEILGRSADAGLHSGKSPTSLAGSAIYLAGILCDDRCTQAAIAEVAQVTTPTIRKRYREQLEVIPEADP